MLGVLYSYACDCLLTRSQLHDKSLSCCFTLLCQPIVSPPPSFPECEHILGGEPVRLGSWHNFGLQGSCAAGCQARRQEEEAKKDHDAERTSCPGQRRSCLKDGAISCYREQKRAIKCIVVTHNLSHTVTSPVYLVYKSIVKCIKSFVITPFQLFFLSSYPQVAFLPRFPLCWLESTLLL